MDIDATGSRVLKFLQAGYVFVAADEVIVGETYVFSSPDYGQIIRTPANKHGDYHYLMKIDKDLYDEDSAAKQDLVDQSERALYAQPKENDMYGTIKINK